MQGEFLDVYIAKVPEGKMTQPLFPPERDEEVRAVGNERLRREKYFVWRLLAYAMKSSLGVDIFDAELKKLASGKWTSSVCELSLSHGGGVLAVALSDRAVGVDVDEPRKVTDSFATRALTEHERERMSALAPDTAEQYIIECWCAKEAVFKMRGGTVLIPSSIDTASKQVNVSHVEVDGCDRILAIASEGCFVPALHKIKGENLIT